MNATKWPSLTEFAKHLGREGICRVEETDKGLQIAWIDDSPEALRRKDALRRKEAQDQGDEEREQRMIREQIKRAQAAAGGARDGDEDEDEEEKEKEKRELRRDGNERIALSFGPRKAEGAATSEQTAVDAGTDAEANAADGAQADKAAPAKPMGFGGISMKLGGKPTTKNVFSQKKNALGGGPKKVGGFEQPKKMSEAERIMKEEMERKRSRESAGFGMPKSKKPRQDG